MEPARPTYPALLQAFKEQPLFKNKTWRISPEPWPLTQEQVHEIENIGSACLEYYKALETLYLRSAKGQSLLRNSNVKTPWVAEYLDRGKPPALLKHSRSLKGEIPMVIRPDLLLTSEGFALTEIDSLPGGIGLIGFLNRLYQDTGFNVIGGEDRAIHAFYESLAAKLPNKKFPLIAILISDEADTYQPEMEWLAKRLQDAGKRVYCLHANEIVPLDGKLYINTDGSLEALDIIYRFWELFDLANLSKAKFIFEAIEKREIIVSPPMRPFQEEKLGLALFHHFLLEDFWKGNLSSDAFRLLKEIVPGTWIMDSVHLPPVAVLNAPWINGKPINSWEQLGEVPRKDRNFIIKLSGFHEKAWGSRSVTLGSDHARNSLKKTIAEVVDASSCNLSIIQDYHKPIRLKHPVFALKQANAALSQEKAKTEKMEGRLRLCPYFYVKNNETTLVGILATMCPADKKIIHGMKDAIMTPCKLAEN